ncbi:hypothetical protein [Salinispora tropica]|uniref:Uncharacterized protein n=1 Tax=Salinispora tropica (strain ATCC BAA-916 / DSM 44818 / JCM 13857 / NBRC 105044 / CNB-440) TaxID=369723 RepID=A4X2D4_SALTO|nr:hypothetical protein [Salinispora tropica]ABP53034.1 hypothetical protein Strop_0552 [Salinispora tropica CNB-440]
MPREVKHPKFGYTSTVYTLDDLIERLKGLRGEHGGSLAVACEKDSSDSVHLLDSLGRYYDAEQAWDDDAHLGAAIVLSIND